jgi:hypothetical protein
VERKERQRLKRSRYMVLQLRHGHLTLGASIVLQVPDQNENVGTPAAILQCTDELYFTESSKPLFQPRDQFAS